MVWKMKKGAGEVLRKGHLVRMKDITGWNCDVNLHLKEKPINAFGVTSKKNN